ncbi:MAG: hypothetical protein JWO41_737 [Candidatus Saccharibacteria bacterium]|nr:hypothetical protein [Candidatus Saccharibacteria bacterium]
MPRTYRKAIISFVIVTATIVSFALFFSHHPEVGRELRHTPPARLAILVALYAVFTASIGLILNATVRLCNVTIPRRESMLITMYSAIINFFGPLQSGPAFRAAYLKKKYDVSLKLYGLATLGYYIAYGLINGIFLLAGWSLWVLALIPLGLLSARFILPLLPIKSLQKLNLKAWSYLCIATALQVGLVSVIFYLELHGISHSISIRQAIIYSGAANLALFVSLTPGAIGFRESFLFFSQRLHHIPSDIIVSANILDRTAYISMLLIITVYLFASHTRSRLLAITKK